MDPDPGIRTTDLQIRIRSRLRILLFSSAADKIPTKNKFFFELLIDGKMLKIKNGEFSLNLASCQILARPKMQESA